MKIVRWWPSELYPGRMYPQIEYPEGTHKAVRLEQWYYIKKQQQACIVDYTRRNGAWSTVSVRGMTPHADEIRGFIEAEAKALEGGHV